MSRSAGAPARVAATATTALAPVAWGTTYVVTTELLPAGHPLFAGLARSLPLGLLALALTRSLPQGRWWWRALALGTLNIGAFFPLLFVAAEHLPGGVAATLGATQPLVVAALAVVVLHEPPSWARAGWGVLGVLGVGLVVLGSSASWDPTGVTAGVAGAVSMGLGVVLTKRWGRPDGVTSLAYAGWQLSAGGLLVMPLVLVIEGLPSQVDAAALVGYAWLALPGGLVAYTLWFRGIRVLPVTATALLGLLSPLVAATLGALLLGELFGPAQSLGFALALAALLGGQLDPGRARLSTLRGSSPPSSHLRQQCAEQPCTPARARTLSSDAHAGSRPLRQSRGHEHCTRPLGPHPRRRDA